MHRAHASVLDQMERMEYLLFWNGRWVSVDTFEFGIGAVGASRPLAITSGPTRLSDTNLTRRGSCVQDRIILPAPTGITC